MIDRHQTKNILLSTSAYSYITIYVCMYVKEASDVLSPAKHQINDLHIALHVSISYFLCVKSYTDESSSSVSSCGLGTKI